MFFPPRKNRSGAKSDNRRVYRITHFTLDLNTGLIQVLADGTNTYLYGTARIGQFTASDSAYFLGDALGSVRQLVDGSGAVTMIKNYEPYGEVQVKLERAVHFMDTRANGLSVDFIALDFFDPHGVVTVSRRPFSL